MQYDQYIDRLKDMAGFAVMISILLVPAIAAVKTRIPTMKGWVTLTTTLSVSCLIVGGLVHPNTLSTTIDCLLVGFMATVIAVGGDSYVLRILGKIKGPLPTVPADDAVDPEPDVDNAGITAFDSIESPTKPDIVIKKTDEEK